MNSVAQDRPAPIVAGLSTFDVGDDVVIVGAGSAPLALSGVGALMWRLVERGERLDHIVRDLADATGVAADVVEARLGELVTQLQDHGVIGREGTGSARESATDAVDIPQVGRPLLDAELTSVDDGRVVHPGSVGRPALFVHWDRACAHCAEIRTTMEADRAALDRHGVALFLVDGRDRATFRFTGTPTGFLVDAGGSLARPMAAGSRELLALVDELCDRPQPPEVVGVARLPAPPAMSVPGDPLQLRCSTWAGTRAYDLHGARVGIRVDSEATGAVLDRLFPGARVDDPYAPANYTVQLTLGDTSEGCTSEEGVEQVLGRGGSELVRSRSAARVVAALLAQLTEDLGLVDGLLPIAAAAVVRGQRAVLVPWAIRRWSPRIQPLLAAHGAAFADGPSMRLDLARGEVVVPEPMVGHDPGILAELEQLDAARGLAGEMPRVRPGRYALGEWWFAGSEERELSAASAVARALLCIGVAPPLDDVVTGLTRCFTEVPAREVVLSDERDFVERVTAS